MIKEAFEKLQNYWPKVSDTIYPRELFDLEDKTLIFGYNLERSTFHLYLENGKFNLVVYKNGVSRADLIVSHTDMSMVDASLSVPTKRVYPEHSDFLFCKLLKDRGVAIPFTNFNEDPDMRTGFRPPFKGLTAKEFTDEKPTI